MQCIADIHHVFDNFKTRVNKNDTTPDYEISLGLVCCSYDQRIIDDFVEHVTVNFVVLGTLYIQRTKKCIIIWGEPVYNRRVACEK